MEKMKEYDDDVHFEGPSLTLFRISYSSTFLLLTNKIFKRLHVPCFTNINKLYFRKPTLNENGVVMYCAAQFACDEDIFRIIIV